MIGWVLWHINPWTLLNVKLFNLKSVISLHTVKWLYIWFLSKYLEGNFISKKKLELILGTQLNGFKYCNLTLIILFNTNDFNTNITI